LPRLKKSCPSDITRVKHLLDVNFNANTKGNLKILKVIADFDMFRVEIDS
jgi:hypothetical protein